MNGCLQNFNCRVLQTLYQDERSRPTGRGQDQLHHTLSLHLENLAQQKKIRIVCVQVRKGPIRDGLYAILGGHLTGWFWRLKYSINLVIFMGNFQNLSVAS